MKDILKYLIPLQPMIKKAMGEWKRGDVLYCMRQESLHYTHEQDCCDLLIPLTIDPVNPERGLWGMLKDIDTVISLTYGWRVTLLSSPKIFEADTPTEAILKALCHQWEVEVK